MSVRPFTRREDREALVNAYLSDYLKKLGDTHLRALIGCRGGGNPLYLKVVLNELRLYGSHSDLLTHIEQDFGVTPVSAFSAMLVRLESDPAYGSIPMKTLVSLVFGWLCHARNGLSAEALAALLTARRVTDDELAARDAVHMLLRQLRSFLANRETRVDFFYDSFRAACVDRYERERDAKQWHGDIAAYLAACPPDDRCRLSELPYQYVMSDRIDNYMRLVFSYDPMSRRLAGFGVQALMEDYRLYACPSTLLMTGFLGLCGTVLTNSPEQLACRLFGHLSASEDARVRALLTQTADAQRKPWLRPVYACFEAPKAQPERNMDCKGELASSVALLAGDALAATIEDNRSVVVWDLERGTTRLRLPAREEQFFRSLQADPNGERMLVYADGKGGACIEVYETVRFTRVLSVPVGSYMPCYKSYNVWHASQTPFALSASGQTVLLMDADYTLGAYSLETGASVCQTDYRWRVNCMSVSPDGLLAVGNIHPQRDDSRYPSPLFQRVKNPVSLFRYDEKARTLTPVGDPVGDALDTHETVAISADETMLAESDGRRVCVWALATGELLARLPQGNVGTLRFLPQRGLLLAAGKSLVLYRTADFAPVLEPPRLGYVCGVSVFRTEADALIRIEEHRLRVLSLTIDTALNLSAVTPDAPLRSVSDVTNGGWVYASAYPNWIEQGKERTAGEARQLALFAFRYNDGACARKAALDGLDNRDFVYIAPSGDCAVSKQFQQQGYVTFKHWTLPDDPLEDEEPLVPELFMARLRDDASASFSTDFANFFQFSTDRRFFAVFASPLVSVYKTDTGRLLGTVNLSRQSGLGKLLGIRKGNDDDLYDPLFEVADQGATLYVLHCHQTKPRLDTYEVKTGKRSLSLPLAEWPRETFGSSAYANPLFYIARRENRLVFASDQSVAVYDLTRNRRLFFLDKLEADEAQRHYDPDVFTACAPDGRFIATSCKSDAHSVNHMVQLWDTEANALLAQFVADGGVGEIRMAEDGRSLFFGMGNGRLCRLQLEDGRG